MAKSNERRNLDISDLRLLMDNYQNIVKMSTILIEQQKQVIEFQKQILVKEDSIATKQMQACNHLSSVASKLDIYTSQLSKTNDSLTGKLEKVDETITDLHLDVTKDHSSLKNKIYVAMGGTAAAIVSLVSLFILVYSK